jgi:hypothetical protein
MDLKNFSTSHWCEERESFVEQLKKSLEFVVKKRGQRWVGSGNG